MSRDRGPGPEARPGGVFAHASEAELARILDFYQVRWEYEPQVFPILWDLEGNVLESFAPDFYLPDLDLFLEITTLQQRLVRKKNRKVRRLRELYPSVRIKLFYARDFRALMLKYGRTGLVAELSGAVGQVGAHFSEPDPGRAVGGSARHPVAAPANAIPGGEGARPIDPLEAASIEGGPGRLTAMPASRADLPPRPARPDAGLPSLERREAHDAIEAGAGGGARRSRAARRRAARRAAHNQSVT